jgi:hypothetical protein
MDRTLSVVRDNHCDIHPIYVDHGLNGRRKFAVWRGQKMVLGPENRELCANDVNVKDD